MIWVIDVCGMCYDVVIGYSVGEIVVVWVMGVLLFVDVVCVIKICSCV